MGTFSKFIRYRGQGKEANVVNVERFGTPSHSLFISTNFWSFRQTTKIEDEDGSVAYRAKSRAISLHDKTTITDARGGLVAKVERKVLTLREYHRVTMADGLRFDIAHDLFQVFEDTAEISGLGWTLRGNYASLNFELYDANGSIIAVVGKKLVSIKDKYAIDVYRPELEREVVAVLVALQHTLRGRTKSNRSSSLVLDVVGKSLGTST